MPDRESLTIGMAGLFGSEAEKGVLSISQAITIVMSNDKLNHLFSFDKCAPTWNVGIRKVKAREY